jgi:hypothetical protein
MVLLLQMTRDFGVFESGTSNNRAVENAHEDIRVDQIRSRTCAGRIHR